MVAVTYGAARIAATSLGSKAEPKSKGFFARLIDAMIEARMRQAYREIEMHKHLMWKPDITPVESKEPPSGR